MRWALLAAVGLSLALSTSATVLTSGVSQRGFVEANAEVVYTFPVSGPGHAVRFEAFPDDPGDTDLRINWQDNVWAVWSSGRVGADEVTYYPPASGDLCQSGMNCFFTVYVLGFTTANFTVIATEFVPSPSPTPTLPPYETIPDSSMYSTARGSEPEQVDYFLLVPNNNFYQFEFHLSPWGDADTDLYVSTLSKDYEWASFNVGGDFVALDYMHMYACTANTDMTPGGPPCGYVVKVYNAGNVGGYNLTVIDKYYSSGGPPTGGDCNPARRATGIFS
jgi:hypothetical protein